MSDLSFGIKLAFVDRVIAQTRRNSLVYPECRRLWRSTVSGDKFRSEIVQFYEDNCDIMDDAQAWWWDLPYFETRVLLLTLKAKRRVVWFEQSEYSRTGQYLRNYAFRQGPVDLKFRRKSP